MDSDATAVVLGRIDYKSYAAACLVCREWCRIAAQIHDRGAALSPILRLIAAFPRANHDWPTISRSPAVPIWYILEHPKLRWSWYFVSKRADLTPDYLLNNPHVEWEWHCVAANESIPIKFILTFPATAKFDITISQRTDITDKVITEYPKFPWQYACIIDRVSVDFIINHPNIDWNFHALARRFAR